MSVKQIQLECTVFEGENSVYLFGADDPNTPVTLVDAGVAVEEVRDQLQSALASEDLSFADIETVFLTHFHGDHSGLAGFIQEQSDATIYAHHDDADLIERDVSAWESLFATQKAKLNEWGMPNDKQDELIPYLEGVETMSDGAPTVTRFEAGDRFEVGDLTFEAVHMPGHTEGQCGFVVDRGEGNELLSGDALLPKYTPNVGGADVRVEKPLQKYLDTLTGIVAADYTVAWPGHRQRIDDPAARAKYIIDHHRERTEKVLAVLRDHGPADAWTVSAHLFGDLHSIHILHGPGEAYAHLSHLEADGVVENSDDGYEIVDSEPALDELFPAVELA